MTFQRGDVVLVPFPFSDLSTAKIRPAVVVSSDLYHLTEPDLLLAALTSQLAGATGPFDYPLSDWRAAGLLSFRTQAGAGHARSCSSGPSHRCVKHSRSGASK